MTNQSADQVRLQFASTYPGSTGDLAHRLWNDLITLNATLATFIQLYSDSDVVGTLNKTAPRFFSWLQGWLRVDLFLRIARLTDSAHTAGRRNVCLAALEEDLRSIGALAAANALGAALVPLLPVLWKVRRIRHRTLAHSDRKTVLREDSPLPSIQRQELESLVDGLGEAFNDVDFLYRKSRTYFKGSDTLTGTEHLLAYLKEGHVAFEDKRRHALGAVDALGYHTSEA